MYKDNRNIIQKVFGLGAADGSGHYPIDGSVIQTWKNNLSVLSTPKNWLDGREIVNTPWLKNMLDSIWNSAYPDIQASGIFSGNTGGIETFCFLSEFPDQSINDLVNACQNMFNVTYKVEKTLNIYNVVLEICLHPNKGLLNVGGQHLSWDNLIFWGTANYNPMSDRCYKVCTPVDDTPVDHAEPPAAADCPCDCKETATQRTIYFSRTPAGSNSIPVKLRVKKEVCTTKPSPATYKFVCADELQRIKDAMNKSVATEIKTGDENVVIVPVQDIGLPLNMGVQGLGKSGNGYK